MLHCAVVIMWSPLVNALVACLDAAGGLTAILFISLLLRTFPQMMFALFSMLCAVGWSPFEIARWEGGAAMAAARSHVSLTLPLSSFSNDEETAIRSLPDAAGGNFTTCTVQKGATLGPGRFGEVGPKALLFDGRQHVSIDDGITVGGYELTICAWAKWSAFIAYSRIVDIGNGYNSDNILIKNEGTASTRTLSLTILRGDTGKSISISNILEFGRWMHICGTVDVDGEMKMYINGVERACTGGSACDASTGKGTKGHVPKRLHRKYAYIGRPVEDTESVHFKGLFKGAISDVTIVDGDALSAAEVAEEMLARAPLTWTFPLDKLNDDESNATITSIGANTGQLSATVHKGATLGPGRFGEGGPKALLFDGVGMSGSDGQHVSIDGGITVGGAEITVCAWANWSAFRGWSRIVDIGNGRDSDNIVLANEVASNNLVWINRHGIGHHAITEKRIDIDGILELDRWMHICGTVEATGEMKVYINGVEQACTDGSACNTTTGKGTKGSTPNRLHRKNAYIGRSNWDDNAYFQGSISAVTIVDGKALTAAEITEMVMRDTTATTTSITTSTTTRLQVNDDCDPLNDNCDKAKNLVCSLEVYECRYGTTSTAITATIASAEESGQEETSNVGGIAGGAFGGAVFLTIFGVLVYRCGRKDLEEVRRRAPPPGARNQRRGVPQQAYGEATMQNPTFDDSPVPAYAEVDEEPAYVPAVPGRATIYDQGRLAGARDHSLRDKRLSQQLANSHA